MCTIVALHGLRADLPLVIAANRDEIYARPSIGPQRLSEHPRVVGGRDARAGGTWLGVTENRLLVAVTNQRTLVPPAQDRRSRGALVMEALQAGSVGAIEEVLRREDARSFNPFNLLFGDGKELRVAYAREHDPKIAIEPLSPGLWVLANDRIGAPEYPKTLRAEAMVRPKIDAPWPELESALRTMLADHTLPPIEAVPAPSPPSRFTHAFLRELQALCIHTEFYGTRSSSIVAIAPDRVATYLFADGPPCTTPFTDVTPLLA
ncbi:MAG: NRDE family protein [Polyangiales bacterium]